MNNKLNVEPKKNNLFKEILLIPFLIIKYFFSGIKFLLIDSIKSLFNKSQHRKITSKKLNKLQKQKEKLEIELEKNIVKDNIINEDNSIVENNPIVNEENININNNINTNNLFNVEGNETYKTYYVYVVKEEDTIDKILDKYKITKEDLELYNDITNIKPLDKIIIPTNGK